MPRDVSGRELAKVLKKPGCDFKRQAGSHLQLVTLEHGKQSITVPDQESLKIGTLNRILRRIASHHGITREDLLRILFE